MCQRDPTLAAIVIAALVLGTTMAVARQRVDDRLAGADAALQAGRYADAAGEYEAWLQAHPDSEQVLYALGVCYIQLGRPAYAADALRRYVRLVPASSRGHALLGLSLLDGAATAAARTALEKALALDPREPLAVETRARVALLDGEPATAVRLLKPLMDASSTPSRDTTTARAAPVLDDDNLRALFAEALIRSGDAPAAAAMLDGYLAADVHRPVPIHVLAAWAHIRSGELRKAADVCEQGIRLHPDSEIEGVYLTLPAPLLAERTAARLRQLQEHLDVSEAIALGRVLTDVDPRRKTRARELAEKVLGEAIALAPRKPPPTTTTAGRFARRAWRVRWPHGTGPWRSSHRPSSRCRFTRRSQKPGTTARTSMEPIRRSRRHSRSIAPCAGGFQKRHSNTCASSG
jgi:tetratricopeptide (TPR) repeat protein